MSVELRSLLERLWDDYSGLNPQASRIHELLSERGESIVNDHIAFRTFDHPLVGVDVLAREFVEHGYKAGGAYSFPAKKLFARHFDPPTPDLPRVFISELKLEECSDRLAELARELLSGMDMHAPLHPDFCVSGRPWLPSYETYEELRRESEYAAWLSAFGFRANHFTVSFNALKTFSDLESFNEFLKENGFSLNAEGGEIKGSYEVYLEQSSTRAAHVAVEFEEGTIEVPGCYY
ncbi:MAG: DUF1338 domain-containing protein, partial [Candidatus Hydrogenedentota bacterium]